MRTKFFFAIVLLVAICVRLSADNVVKIEGKGEYATLREAVNAAESGDVITMIADCEVNDGTMFVSDKAIVLDLNGKKITANFETENCTLFQIQEGGESITDGDLTITDLSKEQTGEITCLDQGKKTLILLKNNGKLTINAGNFTSPETSTDGCCIISVSGGENATLTINGGTFISTKGLGTIAYGVIDNSKETTINGGTIINSNNSTNISSRTIHNTGSLRVLGGNIVSGNDAVYVSPAGKVVLSNAANVTGNITTAQSRPIDEYILSDAANFNLSAPLTVGKISYNRENGGSFGTICLPFVPDANEAITYYELRECDGSTLVLEKSSGFQINTPFIYYSEDKTFEVGTETQITLDANSETAMLTDKDGLQLKGVYKRSVVFAEETAEYDAQNASHILEPNSYYIKDDGFSKANGYFNINPFRAYFTTSSAVGSSRYELGVYDDLAALQPLVSESAEIETIYELGGAAIPHLKKGINIVKFSTGETRKVIVK